MQMRRARCGAATTRACLRDRQREQVNSAGFGRALSKLTSSVGSQTAISALSADRTISTVWRLTWSIASCKHVAADQPVAFEHILRAAILSKPAIVGSLLSRGREFAHSARTVLSKRNTGKLRVCAETRTCHMQGSWTTRFQSLQTVPTQRIAVERRGELESSRHCQRVRSWLELGPAPHRMRAFRSR